MKTKKIEITNMLFQNDEHTIKKGLKKLSGVVNVMINPEHNLVEVTCEHIKRDKIIYRLYALGFFVKKSKKRDFFQKNSSPIPLPQKIQS